MSDGYKCRICGEEHEGMPLSFAAEFPDMYANLEREERDARTVTGSDPCNYRSGDVLRSRMFGDSYSGFG